MASTLNSGRNTLLGFTRQRIGLRPVKREYDNTRPYYASIHHGGDVGRPRMTFRAASATVREWQAFHINGRGWRDLGYHVLVDGLGRVYRGRPVSETPAAVEGHNTGSVAICFMQDGRSHGLNRAQRRTLRILFEVGIKEWGVPPLKQMAADPYKTAGVFGHNEFSGHKSNACPGTKILTHLKWRRSRYA